jgi:outer membrane protein OmpA-like peptidoglycan-associated protein
MEATLFRRIRLITLLCLPLIFSSCLQGCASSSVSREASNQIDVGAQNASNMFSGNGSIANSYQNTTQTTKGVIIGGTAGAVAGGLTPGVGLFPGLAMGAIMGGAYGAYIDSFTTLSDKLENRGVKVIVLGDQVMMVVSSTRIFDGMTTNINTDAYSTLDMIGQQINTYPNMSVKVAAYVNNAGPASINQSLSQQQADAVAKYLWRTKVNTRMLYSIGMGDSHLVMKSCPELNENYRIEITLEKLPV